MSPPRSILVASTTSSASRSLKRAACSRRGLAATCLLAAAASVPAATAPLVWEPLAQEPAFQALDSGGQKRAVEVYRHLIRSSSLTAPMRAYQPPSRPTGSVDADYLARRLREARERVARLRAEGPETLPGMAGIADSDDLDVDGILLRRGLEEPAPVSPPPPPPLSEEEGYLRALLGLPTMHAEAPRSPAPAPTTTPAPAAKPAPVAAVTPKLPSVIPPAPAAAPGSVRDPSAPLDRPTLGGAGVTVQPGGEGAWEGIAAGEMQPVPWGTVVRTSRTDRGRVVLPGGRGVIQLEPSSEVKLVPGWVRLIRGELRVKVPEDSKTTTEVRTPKGRLKVGPGGEARVRPGGFARVQDPVRRVG